MTTKLPSMRMATGGLAGTWAVLVSLAFLQLAGTATTTFRARAAVLASCALPFVLTSMVALILQGQDERSSLGLSAPDAAPTGRDFRAQARDLWAIEAERSRRGRSERNGYLLLFGLLTSISLLASSLVFFTLNSGEIKSQPPADTFGVMMLMAAGIVAGTIMSFFISLGQLVVRAARQDLTPRIVGSASRSILVVILTVIIVIGIGSLGEDEERWIESYNKAVLAGLVAGLMGDQLIEAIGSAVELVVGSTPPDGDDEEDAFHWIDGMEDEHRPRLAELGVTSVHALAFGSTAAIFFATRYDLHQICDWQDQALLVMLLGRTRASAWRGRFGVRGGADARRVAAALLERRAAVTQLGYGSATDAELALMRLLENEDITRLAYWRTCSPVQATQPAVAIQQPVAIG